MNNQGKRKEIMGGPESSPKRVKKECSYGERCYRRNPAHFREFSHPHLESILDNKSEDGDYIIPEKLSLQRQMILEQLEVIVEKQLYEPKRSADGSESSSSSQSKQTTKYNDIGTSSNKNNNIQHNQASIQENKLGNQNVTLEKNDGNTKNQNVKLQNSDIKLQNSDVKLQNSDVKLQNSDSKLSSRHESSSSGNLKMDNRDQNNAQRSISPSHSNKKDSDYRPIVPPARRAEDFLKVVVPKGRMAQKHAAAAPYYIFYTTITDAKETHRQPFSITFQEILDSSLGELKCSLQINFMVEIGWLLAQYYFAGYSEKKLTILYGEECPDLKTINKKKPQVDAHYVQMSTPFGKHHTKMMLLCYEDGSLRVVISTANLYYDDWENRTQGLWMSPPCPELPADAMPHHGESPTDFKKCLLRYLNHYHMPQLSYYVERVKRCDFSQINVFLIASAPGSHFDMDWGMTRVGSLLRQHCCIPPEETRQWPLIAQASSIGSYGKEPKLWLTGDFLHHFTKIKNQSQMLSTPPDIKLIYPSLENVQQSHDGLLGGGCLPYAAQAHAKQPWLNNYLYQWKATSTNRNKAMPHIKSYTRVSKDAKKAAFYLLTSGNVSKAAWGALNKGNGALRIMSYEAGVLLLPQFLIKEDFFPLQAGAKNKLVIPYDLPPTKYTDSMSPWVSDYLM